MRFFDVFAILGIFAVGALASVCFAMGLISLCEYAEQKPNFLKKLVKRISWAVASLHILFFLIERLSLWRLLLSGAALYVHYRLILDLPKLELVPACANAVIVIVNHFMWFAYFIKHYYSPLQVISFYLIMVWAVPFAIVVSYSSSEILPGLYDDYRTRSHQPNSPLNPKRYL